MGINDPVTALTGVGPKKQAVLNQLGIETIADLLAYYPKRYEDGRPKDLASLPPQSQITLSGVVVGSANVFRYGYKRTRLTFNLQVQGVSIRVTFFNQPWLAKQVHPGEQLLVYGRFDRGQATMAGAKILTTVPDTMDAVYRVNKSIRQSTLRDLIETALRDYKEQIPEVLPKSIRDRYRLLPHLTTLQGMHFPANPRAFQLAQRTAKFEEFFLYTMNLQLLKQSRTAHQGVQIDVDETAVAELIDQLPFQLTAAQKRVVTEIDDNLVLHSAMNRLLQGDVGSGKTVVAAITMYAAITAGYQVALMVPTELLAEQHANSLARLFNAFPAVSIALLTGDTKAAVRRELLPRIKDGTDNLIIGTHALIQDAVHFKNLGYIVIDEQHRFGVNQRAKLRAKGDHPNMLAMTATPIPRTLAITSFGEMDVSLIDQMPAGRKPVLTNWINHGQVQDVLPMLHQQLASGAQIYVVAPLIEDAGTSDLIDTRTIYELFQKAFPDYQVGILHGQMKDDEKNETMAAFKANQIQLLVSTTVIEVGVDVANATVMMIYNADRFGLAQLHQLRGRVGRSAQQSYCILVSDTKSEVGTKRMQVMCETNDGFAVAEADLRLRGQGDLMGRQQSGAHQFKVADPVADNQMLFYAQMEATKLVSVPNWQDDPANQDLLMHLNTKQLNQSLD